MLISAKIDLPKNLFVHGWVLSKGAKMAKSTGITIDPFEQIKKYGVDPFRFYILSAMPIDGDGDYSEEIVKKRINTELVGNFSNLCYRVLSFTAKNYNSEIKTIDGDEVIKQIEDKFNKIRKAYEEYDFKKAVDMIIAVSALGNQYFQKKEPWKSPENSQEILGTCINIIKNLSILIKPIIPELANKLQKQLNLKDLTWDELNFDLKNHKIGKPEILVQKIK
jgi:methionyl-tRNA synthetase